MSLGCGSTSTFKSVENFPQNINWVFFFSLSLVRLVYYNQLPMNVPQITEFIKHREEFMKFNRDFEPIR